MSDKVCFKCGRSPEVFRGLVGEYKAHIDQDNWQVLKDWVEQCSVCSEVLWRRYTKASGRCLVCDVKMAEHPQCPACTSLVGPGHGSTYLAKIGQYELCEACIHNWKKLPVGIIYALALESFVKEYACRVNCSKYARLKEGSFYRAEIICP